MKRQFRILKHQEFDRIIRSGKSLRTPHFSLCYETNELGYSRIGIAVGKANGKAVVRVKEKRQVRAIFAERDDYRVNVNLIVIIRPSYDPERYQEAKDELNKALDTIKERQN
ncbi:MAG: ribonuclease P protein component [Bacilli bacterium]|nr:ribonuclease P protein component [Bacilli bacterium]